MEEDQHEDEEGIGLHEEIDEEEADEDDDDDEEEEEEEEEEDLHSMGDPEREAAMRRRLMVITIPDVSTVRVEDDHAAFVYVRRWQNDRYIQLCATCTRFSSIELKFGPEATVRGAQHLMDGFWERPPIKHLKICLTEDEYEMEPILPSALHFLGECLPAIPELEIHTEVNDLVADRLGAKLLGNKSIKKMTFTTGSDLTKSGARRLASGLASCKIMEQLDLNFQKSRDDSAVMQHLFAKAIKNLHTVNLITSTLNDSSATILGDALDGNQALQTLSLQLDETFSAAGATGLAKGLRLSKITKLIQKGDGVGEKAQTIIYEQGICRSQSIRHLCIGYFTNKASVTGLAICLPLLESFEMDDHRSMPVTEFLRLNFQTATKLSVLMLGPMLVSASDVIRLSEVLPDLVSLTRLHVRCNLTCEEGAAWTEEVENAAGRRLLYTDLEARNIRAIGAEALMMAVANHPSLVELDLSRSADVAFMGLEMIGLHLANVKLKKLYLYMLDDAFCGRGKRDDVDRARTRASQALLAGVRSNLFLQTMYVKYLYLPKPMWKEIKFYLELNKSGRYLLHGEHHGVAVGVWSLILAKCRNKTSVMYSLLREQPQLLLLAATVEVGSPARRAKRRRENFNKVVK